MSSTTITVRPGIFVIIKTHVAGPNVSYQRVDLSPNDANDASEPSETEDDEPAAEYEGTKKSKKTVWKTTKVVLDPEEEERASAVRGKARSIIESICSKTVLGPICALDKQPLLKELIAKAEQMVAEFNATAKFTRIGFYTHESKMETDDSRAMKMITQEIGELIKAMDSGINNFDPKAITAAATRAQEAASALDEMTQERVQAAVDQARKAARTIVKRIQKEGEDRSLVMMDIQRGMIEKARITFLDMSGESNTVEALPAIDAQRFADLDMGGEQVVMPESITAPVIEMDR